MAAFTSSAMTSAFCRSSEESPSSPVSSSCGAALLLWGRDLPELPPPAVCAAPGLLQPRAWRISCSCTWRQLPAELCDPVRCLFRCLPDGEQLLLHGSLEGPPCGRGGDLQQQPLQQREAPLERPVPEVQLAESSGQEGLGQGLLLRGVALRGLPSLAPSTGGGPTQE